jgi:hypothetical protein
MIYRYKTQKYVSYLIARVTRAGTGSRSVPFALRADPSPVILSAAKNLWPHLEILRCAQNDRHSGPGLVKGTLLKLALALVNALTLCLLALLITSCNWPGAQQSSQPDPRLKVFHVLSARIIMLDTQAEVDGTLQNTSQSDRFPYDVTVIATFYNSAGNIVGQAGGVAEDVYPGMVRPFALVGQVDSTQYSHMVVTVVSLKERRIEKIIPTPSIVP